MHSLDEQGDRNEKYGDTIYKKKHEDHYSWIMLKIDSKMPTKKGEDDDKR